MNDREIIRRWYAWLDEDEPWGIGYVAAGSRGKAKSLAAEKAAGISGEESGRDHFLDVRLIAEEKNHGREKNPDRLRGVADRHNSHAIDRFRGILV